MNQLNNEMFAGAQRLQVRLRGARPRHVRREEPMGGQRRQRGQGSLQRFGPGRRHAIGRVHGRPRDRIQRRGEPIRQR